MDVWIAFSKQLGVNHQLVDDSNQLMELMDVDHALDVESNGC